MTCRTFYALYSLQLCKKLFYIDMWKDQPQVVCWQHIDSLPTVINEKSPPYISDTSSPYPDTVHAIYQYQEYLSH